MLSRMEEAKTTHDYCIILQLSVSLCSCQSYCVNIGIYRSHYAAVGPNMLITVIDYNFFCGALDAFLKSNCGLFNSEWKPLP